MSGTIIERDELSPKCIVVESASLNAKQIASVVKSEGKLDEKPTTLSLGDATVTMHDVSVSFGKLVKVTATVTMVLNGKKSVKGPVSISVAASALSQAAEGKSNAKGRAVATLSVRNPQEVSELCVETATVNTDTRRVVELTLQLVNIPSKKPKVYTMAVGERGGGGRGRLPVRRPPPGRGGGGGGMMYTMAVGEGPGGGGNNLFNL